jgi:acylglycerol lipase
MGCGSSAALDAAAQQSLQPPQPYLDSADGVLSTESIRDFERGKRNIVSWLPLEGSGSCKAIVLVSHGLHEHANRHYPIGRVLARAGYAVFGIDHTSHGLSDGRKGYISDWEVMTNDFVEFARLMQEENPNLPTVILAHSMGTMVAFTAVLKGIANVRGVVFSATPLFVGPAAGSPFGIKALHPMTQTSAIEPFARMLASTDPSGPCAPIDSAAITSDPEEKAIHDHDERMYHGQIMNITAYQLTKMTKFIKLRVGDFNLPFLALHGTDDLIALPRGSQFLFDNTGTAPESKQLINFPGMRHELFHEKAPGRDEAMQQVVDYYDKLLQPESV